MGEWQHRTAHHHNIAESRAGMKNYLPGWPGALIKARVEENLLIKPDWGHRFYDRSRVKLQRVRKAKVIKVPRPNL
jgi:hypothetical protein